MPKIRGVKPDYWTDEDIVDLSIPARLLFIGLWTYACDNGHFPDKPKQIKMRVFPGDDINVAELLRELEANGRIKRENGWTTIPKFAHHQRPNRRFWLTCEMPGCVKPEKDSQPETPSGQGGPSLAKGGKGGPTADGEVDVDCEGEGEGEGEEQHLVAAIATTTPPRPDVDRICNHLADRIQGNGGKRPTITKGWRDAARLMLDRDHRSEQDIHGAIDWCQSDEFWRANILSMPKLREKYDQLRMQAERKRAPSRNQETEDLFSRAAVRMGVIQGGQS